MKYAIIQVGGKQYKTSEGQEILVDKLESKSAKIVIPQVLMIRSQDLVLVGTPYVEKAQVVAKLLKDVKGKKLKVSKFKAKVRFRRTIGFRPEYSKIQIEKIVVGREKKN